MADDEVLDAQRHVWTVGDYPAVARRLLPISEALVARLGITAGETVLDVATGDGNAAVVAAQRGASVTGIDLTPAQIERATERCAQVGAEVELRVGNAEQLEAVDFSYDVVLSVMGMIFAPDHQRAAAEMVRVCRPGGRVGMTSWAPGGFFGAWRSRIEEFLPPMQPGQPDPDGWSEPYVVRERFAAVGLEVEVEVVPFAWEFGSTVEAVEFYLATSGPFILFMEAAAANGFGDQARAMLLETVDDANQGLGAGGPVRLNAPFTLAVGTR
jgi:ubiquinone/menaquinone biosynthesis C-methylase UbiE